MNLQIYVVHATHLAIRLPIINQLVDKLRDSTLFDSVNMELLTQYDPKDISADVVRQLVQLNKETGIDFYNELVKNLHIKQVSNAFKHLMAIRKVADAYVADSVRAEKTMYMVLEDDVVYGDDVASNLDKTIKLIRDYKSSWDMIMLGIPSLQQAEKDKPIIPVSSMFRVMPCCDSYFVNPRTAEHMASKLLPIRLATNAMFSYIAEKNSDINIHMTIPNVFVDGSKLGIYISNITPNNKLFLNKEYNKIHNIVHKESDKITAEDKTEVKTAMENIRFTSHPDIVYLNALFKAKTGEPKEALPLYTQALQVYQQNDAIINSESEFLMDYMRVFRDVQEVA